MADIVRAWPTTATKRRLNLVFKFRIFCWFENCHEVCDTHAPICLDSWQVIFLVLVSSYQRWSWAILSLAACAFLAF